MNEIKMQAEVRKIRRGSRELFDHVVMFDGVVVDRRQSRRQYRYAIIIEGVQEQLLPVWKANVKYHRAEAARYRLAAEQGGDRWSPEQYRQWAQQSDANAESYEEAIRAPFNPNRRVYGYSANNRASAPRCNRIVCYLPIEEVQ